MKVYIPEEMSIHYFQPDMIFRIQQHPHHILVHYQALQLQMLGKEPCPLQ